ncbi:hypothetical protein D3C87_2143120 [compost metagenome]
MQNRAQRRFGSTRAAEKIDEGIFEARRGLFNLNLRHSLCMTDIVGGGLFFEDHAHRTPLNHSVADLRKPKNALQ